MSAHPVKVVITYRAQPGREEAARRDLAALIATVREKEPDCLGITMLTGAEDAARILLYETWTSREAYEGPHMRTPHLTAFRERAPGLFAGPPDIVFWNVVADV